MKITKVKFIIISITILLSVGFIGSIAYGKNTVINQSASGFVSSKVLSDLSLNDAQISSFWNDITAYQNISEFGAGGYVKFANNGTHLFSLLVWPQSNAWVSIEFEPDPDLCMANLNDGWSLYVQSNPEDVEARDIKFVGTVMPEDDTQSDLSVEGVFMDNYAYAEVVRPFDTGDSDGFDIAFYNGSLNMMQFASKDDHIGFHEDYYLLVTDKLPGEGSDDPPVDIPVGANLGQIKFILFGITPIGILIFIGFHAVRRVLTNPIEHKYERIVDNNHSPPTFMERWRETFSSK
jgi:hypothetical protein